MIISELINPAFSHILADLYGGCETEEPNKLYTACQTLWLGVDALNKVTCTFKEGGQYTSVAMGNEMQKAADYIEHRIGVDPISNKDFAKW